MAVIFGFLSGALNSSLLALINSAISQATAGSSKLWPVFVGLCLLAGGARVVSEGLLVRLGQDSVLALRMSLARQVVAVPLRRLEELGAHRVLSVLTDDVPNIANTAGLIPVLCINLGLVISSLAYMGWLQWRLFLAVLVFAVIGILTYQFGVNRAVRYFQRARKSDNDMQRHFQGLVHGIKELKMHEDRREEFLAKTLQETALRLRQENVKGLTIYSIAASWGQLLVFMVMGVEVFVLAGLLGATGSALIGFSLALLYMMSPLQVLMNSVPGLGRARIALANIKEMGLGLTSPGASPAELPADDQKPHDSAECLELIDVAYTYPCEESGDRFTLGPLSLTVAPGELVFIAGGNGSGKTTLGKLLLGLYTPEEGEIRYKGRPVTDTNRETYRQLFSAVFSDCFVFESLLGTDLLTVDERAQQYLSALQLDHKVKIQKGVFSTRDLSQGQRKRLALLTSYLEDRPIFFFDEWAADQDPAFKEVFYHSILPGLKERGKTVVAISHDDRYYHVADRIINLESGRLSEDFAGVLSASRREGR